MKIKSPFVRTPLTLKVLFFLYVYSFFGCIYMLVYPTPGQRGGPPFIALQVVMAAVVLGLILVRHPRTWIVGIAQQLIVFVGSTIIMINSKDAIREAIQKSQPSLSAEQLDQAASTSLGLYVPFLGAATLLVIFLWTKCRKHFQQGTVLDVTI